MAESSSQIRIVPSGMRYLVLVLFGFGGGDRQQYPEHRAARLGFAFDHPAMVGDDLRHQRESQSRAMRFRGDERIENIRQQIGRDALAVVAHSHFERQAQPML